ncbi:hypothetical protein NL676_030906 [Syzygium grande]|nr:hypothetical protein NL676_030906 [Syzygium grande]
MLTSTPSSADPPEGPRTRPYDPYRDLHALIRSLTTSHLPGVPLPRGGPQAPPLLGREPQYYTGSGYLAGAPAGAAKGTLDGVRSAEPGDTPQAPRQPQTQRPVLAAAKPSTVVTPRVLGKEAATLAGLLGGRRGSPTQPATAPCGPDAAVAPSPDRGHMRPRPAFRRFARPRLRKARPRTATPAAAAASIETAATENPAVATCSRSRLEGSDLHTAANSVSGARPDNGGGAADRPRFTHMGRAGRLRWPAECVLRPFEGLHRGGSLAKPLESKGRTEARRLARPPTLFFFFFFS